MARIQHCACSKTNLQFLGLHSGPGNRVRELSTRGDLTRVRLQRHQGRRSRGHDPQVRTILEALQAASVQDRPVDLPLPQVGPAPSKRGQPSGDPSLRNSQHRPSQLQRELQRPEGLVHLMEHPQGDGQLFAPHPHGLQHPEPDAVVVVVVGVVIGLKINPLSVYSQITIFHR